MDKRQGNACSDHKQCSDAGIARVRKWQVVRIGVAKLQIWQKSKAPCVMVWRKYRKNPVLSRIQSYLRVAFQNTNKVQLWLTNMRNGLIEVVRTATQ